MSAWKTDSAETDVDNDAWQRNLIEQLSTDALTEKRRARRWGIFFKFLVLAYLFAWLILMFPEQWPDSALSKDQHTALVDLEGVIASGEDASADNVVKGLREAFEDKKTKGVILRINSPGGSPVQSSYINNEIKRLREKYPETPLYAVVSDICASGGYYVAAAADRIYVNQSSVLGSIGVLMSSFGFVESMEKLGIERRLMTAGDHKAIFDPFSPQSAFDQEHLQHVLDQLHEEFIRVVKEGRGDRLKIDDKTFSGLFWSGKESIELGLADEFGSAGYVAREVIGEKEIVNFTPKKDVLERLASRVGSASAKTLAKIIGVSTEQVIH